MGESAQAIEVKRRRQDPAVGATSQFEAEHIYQAMLAKKLKLRKVGHV